MQFRWQKHHVAIHAQRKAGHHLLSNSDEALNVKAVEFYWLEKYLMHPVTFRGFILLKKKTSCVADGNL